MIKTSGLTKLYDDVTAVDNLNLEIYKNEIFGLLGVNGAGKTTTIKMLCRTLKPSSGKIMIGGRDVDDDTAKSMMNFSPQETAVAPNLTVRENLEFMAGIYGIKGNEAHIDVKKVIDDFNLTSVLNKKAKALSGGWQRRLSIAMAMVTNPKVVFLDEPSLGLDVLARRELWKTIEKLKGKTTIILTTHYLEEAEHLCDRIGIMEGGKLIMVGTVQDIKDKAGADDFENAFIKLAGGAGDEN